MRLRIYQSDKGDCLLVTGTQGGTILVDGGMRDAFVAHVRDDLCALKKAGGKIDLVYVSHIDQDHIAGVLELLNNIMEWRVFKFRTKAGAKNLKAPAFGELPEIGEIWHNAFSALLEENAGNVEKLLAQTSLVLGLSNDGDVRNLALQHHELAFSVSEAIRVSQRVSASQLQIPLNKQFGGKLILRRKDMKPVKIGSMGLLVLGPAPVDVENLRKDWNKWLTDNKKGVVALKKASEDDARSIGNSAAALDALLANRVDLDLAGDNNLGNRTKVTPPNLASVMLLLEEGKKKVLLTGDGAWQDILDGLKHQKKLDANGKIHVDVLKVQHHGSEHNMKKDFTDVVSADHYIFCGNGKHENPDERIVALVCDEHRKRRPNDTFTLWFNCAASIAPAGAARKHMQKVEKLVAAKMKASDGHIKAKYLKQSHFDLTP